MIDWRHNWGMGQCIYDEGLRRWHILYNTAKHTYLEDKTFDISVVVLLLWTVRFLSHSRIQSQKLQNMNHLQIIGFLLFAGIHSLYCEQFRFVVLVFPWNEANITFLILKSQSRVNTTYGPVLGGDRTTTTTDSVVSNKHMSTLPPLN